MVPLESTDHSDHEEYEKSKVTKVPVNSEKYLRPVSGAKKAIKVSCILGGVVVYSCGVENQRQEIAG